MLCMLFWISWWRMYDKHLTATAFWKVNPRESIFPWKRCLPYLPLFTWDFGSRDGHGRSKEGEYTLLYSRTLILATRIFWMNGLLMNQFLWLHFFQFWQLLSYLVFSGENPAKMVSYNSTSLKISPLQNSHSQTHLSEFGGQSLEVVHIFTIWCLYCSIWGNNFSMSLFCDLLRFSLRSLCFSHEGNWSPGWCTTTNRDPMAHTLPNDCRSRE